MTLDLHAVDSRHPQHSRPDPMHTLVLQRLLCFRPSLTQTTVPRAACLHQPTFSSKKTDCCIPVHVLRLLCAVCFYRQKVWSGNVRRITKRGSPSCSPILKSITCPISSPTSPRRPVCTILFWVRLHEIMLFIVK